MSMNIVLDFTLSMRNVQIIHKDAVVLMPTFGYKRKALTFKTSRLSRATAVNISTIFVLIFIFVHP